MNCFSIFYVTTADKSKAMKAIAIAGGGGGGLLLILLVILVVIFVLRKKWVSYLKVTIVGGYLF